MAQVVFLDFVNNEVVKVALTEEELCEIDGPEYNEDFESWATDKGKDDEWNIDFSNCQWMWFEGCVKERIV